MNRPDDDRRRYPRQAAALPIVLRVELHGFHTDSERFEARGHTRNISHGGLLAVMDREVQRNDRVLTHFPDAEGTLGRKMIFGTVRRCTQAGGQFEVAVIFDTPLAGIELPAQTSA